MKLALYPRKEIAWDAHLRQGFGGQAKISTTTYCAVEFTIGHLVNHFDHYIQEEYTKEKLEKY